MSFKLLEHTADLKIEVTANSLEKSFEEASMALKKAIMEDMIVKPKINKKIKIKGIDLKSLLYNFLEEFIYLLDAEDFLFSKIKSIKINEKDPELKAEILGDKASNYKFSNDVKAITYNDMIIEKKDKEYKLIFVLDV